MAREELWVTWKNDNCPSIELEKAKSVDNGDSSDQPLAKRQYIKPSATAVDGIDLGSRELSKLWTLGDNFVACADESRKFLPPLATFVFCFLASFFFVGFFLLGFF